MGYLFVILSVFFGAIKGFCGKKISGCTNGLKDAMLLNSIRMLICMIISTLIAVVTEGAKALTLNSEDILSVVLSGVFTSVFVVTWLVAVKNGAYLMLDVFLMLSVIIPLIFSSLIYGDAVSIKQWFGVGILIIAALLLCSYNNKIKTRLNFAQLCVLLLCGIACGVSDFSQKIFILNKIDTPISTFNLFSYLISFTILAFLSLCVKSDNVRIKNRQFSKKVLLYIFIMSICLFLNTFFQTAATEYLTSAELFPISKSLSLIFSVIIAAVFLKEKINTKCIVGITLALVGIIIINT